jgi:hypothetical protein
VLILFQVSGISCQHDKVSRVRIELHDLPNDKPAATKPAPPPPECPKAGVASLQPGAPGTGDHKVTLTWNASAPSNNPESAAVGYCLYRSRVQYRKELKQDPRCTHCEQINKVPVATTGCVDDVVADNTKYYYVVTAIDANSIPSAPSNDVFVPIPSAHSVKPSQPATLPLCRAALLPQGH